MRLNHLNVFKFSKPFVFEFISSHTLRSASDSILMELIFDNGISGWGESAPRPYVTRETSESVIEFIKEMIAPILFNIPINSIEDTLEILDCLEEKSPTQGITCFNSAIGACDIALLDALAKAERISLHSLLGPVIRNEVPYSVSVPLIPVSLIPKTFLLVEGLNLKNAKIIMSPDPEENYQRAGCIRSLFGDSADIRLDANGKWTVGQALANLDRLKELNIAAVEQPVAADDLNGLKEIRKKTGIPVVVDESMCCLEDARKLIEAEVCDMLNIKLSKCGGILRSKKIADFAASFGIQCQLGSHVGETSVLHRAGECFAKTTPNILFYEGCSPLLFSPEINTIKQDADSPYGLGSQIKREDLQPIFSIGRR